MELLVTSFWILHLSATAVILSGWLVHLFRLRYGLTVMVWAARSQIIIGVILVNLTFASGLNYGKTVVKLSLAMAVVACAEIANARAKRGQSSVALVTVSAAITVLIAVISFLW